MEEERNWVDDVAVVPHFPPFLLLGGQSRGVTTPFLLLPLFSHDQNLKLFFFLHVTTFKFPRAFPLRPSYKLHRAKSPLIHSLLLPFLLFGYAVDEFVRVPIGAAAAFLSSAFISHTGPIKFAPPSRQRAQPRSQGLSSFSSSSSSSSLTFERTKVTTAAEGFGIWVLREKKTPLASPRDSS